jgi:nitrogen fixation NifU-like protein
MSALPKLYDDVVMDHIKNARNYRAVEAPDRHAEGRNRLCGDHVTLTLRTAGDRIRDAAFQCECCGISMASASIMTQSMRGLSTDNAIDRAKALAAAVDAGLVERVEGIDDAHVAVLLAVSATPSRKMCAKLGWLGLAQALADESTIGQSITATDR